MSDNPANLSKESRRILNDEPFPGSPDDMMETIATLRARMAKLEAAHIEAMAELIYLRRYGKDGAVWWANESKDVWRDKARAALKDAHSELKRWAAVRADRVAKLEALLSEARQQIYGDCWVRSELQRKIDAALKDTPE